MNTSPFNVTIRPWVELAAPVFWGPTLAALEGVPEFVADDSALVITAFELDRPVIDAVAPVAVRVDSLESAVLVASAERSIEPRNGGKRSSEVIARIDADIGAVVVPGEAVSDVAAPVTEPAVISTR